MGLKDLFRRKKSNDDDDDDFEEDDFEEEGGVADAVVDANIGEVVDDEGGDDPGFGGSSLDEGLQGDLEKAKDALGNDETVSGDDSSGEDQTADDSGELDVEGDEPGIADDDDEYEEYDDGGLFSNPLVLYSTIGIGVLLIFIAVGVGGWLFLSDGTDEVADQIPELSGNAIALPPISSGSSGGLNDLLGADDKIPESDVPSEPAPKNEPTLPVGTGLLNSVPSAGGLNALASGGLNTVGNSSSTAAGLIIQASTVTAFESFLDHPTPGPLERAPDPDFLEIREDGEITLPKVASDGRLPWVFYSRPSAVAPDRRRVAILVTGLGLSQAATLSAIEKLPPAVTLSFSPYADELDQWMLRSRRAGHEVMLGLPLESARFPIEDPGPMSLQTFMSDQENLTQLEAVMALFQGYIGFEVVMGSKFTTSERHMRSMLDVLNSRGLMILEGTWNNRSLLPKLGGELGMPRASSDMRLDGVSALSAIDTKLSELDTTIITRNQAIATTTMSPAIMGRLKTWFQTLPGKNVELVPVSALVSTTLTSTNVE